MEYDHNDEKFEEVDLIKYEGRKDGSGGRKEAYEEGDDDDEEGHAHGGPGVQCATQ